MKRAGAMVLTGLALAGCSSPTPLEPAAAYPPITTAAPSSPRAAAPSAPPRVAQAPGPARDACGAASLQSLIGRPRTEIPIPVDPARQRVACTTCPVTQDMRPDRLNFLFDADTGLIRKISCG